MFTFKVKVCTADAKFVYTAIAPCSCDVVDAAIAEFGMPLSIVVTAGGAA